MFLTVGESLAKVFTLLAFTFLGRMAGPERYGDLEFVIACIAFFSLFVQMGVGSYGAREIAKNPARAQTLIGEVIEVRIALSAASFLLLLGFAAIAPKSFEVQLTLVAYGASLLALPGILLWFFQGHDLMHWVAAASLLRHVAFGAAVLTFFRAESPLWLAGVFEAASIAISAGFCMWIAMRRMRYRAPRLRFEPGVVWGHLRAAAPIGFANLAWAGLWFSPLVILGLTQTGPGVGWFAASHRATMAINTFVWWYFFNLLPSISRCVARPPEELRKLIGGSLALTAWGTLLAALLLALPANELLALAYGAEFAEAGPMLAALIWTIPLAAAGGHYRWILVAYNLQQRLAWQTAAGAVVTAAVTWAAASRAGAMGAAAGLLAGNALCFALHYATTRAAVAKVGFARPLGKPLAALALALTLAAAVSDFNVWFRTAAAGALFAGLFLWWERREIPRWARELLGSPSHIHT